MTLKEDGLTGEIEAIPPFDNELNMILAHLVQELSRRNQIFKEQVEAQKQMVEAIGYLAREIGGR